MREIFRKAGFFMISILSLLYIIFSRNFAEARVQVPFLNFPIFIGEILLFIFLVLSFFVFDFRSIKGWQWYAIFYFVCVILKAFWGYSLWGPLAFRHAALFYYLIFIFFGFIFYRRAFLSEPLKIFVAFLILGLCIMGYFYEYWTLTLWIIAFILAKSLRHKRIKYFFYAGLLAVVFLSYKTLIVTSRTFIVGNIIAIVFLTITLLYIGKIKIYYKVTIVAAIFILLAAFAFKYSSLSASGTIFDIKGTIGRYKELDKVIMFRRPHHVSQDLKDIKLFNPEQSKIGLPVQPTLFVPASNKMLQAETPKKKAGLSEQPTLFVPVSNKMLQAETPVVPASNKMLQAETPKKKAGLSEQSSLFVPASNKMLQAETPIMEGRSSDNAYSNTMFRLFIWRDMIFEFSRYWPILGFSFGKPFRSESLEILGQAGGEWKRDGWIEPHNSYLNILYRMGILGVTLIGFLIWQFSNMVKSFVAFKSLDGILLCSILINWMVAANFLPLLELPYNAIPFWALWGVALGYLKGLKKQKVGIFENFTHS